MKQRSKKKIVFLLAFCLALILGLVFAGISFSKKEKVEVTSNKESFSSQKDSTLGSQKSFCEADAFSFKEESLEEKKVNFTQYLASLLSTQMMLEFGKENPVSSKAEIENLSQILEKKMPELLNQFEVEKDELRKEEIETIPHSKENVNQYLEALGKTLDKVFKENPPSKLLGDFFQKNDPSSLKNFLFELKISKEKLKKIKVPEGYLEIHQEIFGLISFIQKIVEAILDYQNDPLKAIIAIEISQNLLPQKIDQTFGVFREKLIKDGFKVLP